MSWGVKKLNGLCSSGPNIISRNSKEINQSKTSFFTLEGLSQEPTMVVHERVNVLDDGQEINF